jgi:uncharacterized protein
MKLAAKPYFKKALALIAAFFLFLPAFAQYPEKVPDRPSPQRLVNVLGSSDASRNFLSPEEKNQLEAKLVKFSRETSNQITVVIVDSLNGLNAWEYATSIGDKWGVGLKEKDNGIVILIKPTQADGGRDYFIAPGSGLQGVIPDALAKRVAEQYMVPEFKAGNNFKGLDDVTTQLMQLASGEISEKDLRRGSGVENHVKNNWKLYLGILIVLIFLFRGGGGRRRGYTVGRGGGFYGGGFGGFGGGFGGGGGGGGFGGFGGGGFNGGGAGGKW